MKSLVVGIASALIACVLAGCSTASDSPAANQPASTAAPTRSVEPAEGQTTPAVSDEALVLGPDGVGLLRLGMTHQQVIDTDAGRVHVGSRHDGWPAGCRLLQYHPQGLGRTPGDTTNAVISDKHGLERVYATPKMVTPEGISLGSTIADVRDAYNRPGLTSGDLVVVPASNQSVYRIQLGGVVMSMSLEVRRPYCII